jgi:hypothetical protein
MILSIFFAMGGFLILSCKDRGIILQFQVKKINCLKLYVSNCKLERFSAGIGTAQKSARKGRF